MASTRNSERIRFRYGICLNDNCSKSKTKEIQEIPARKELACAECGKPLRECPPPKRGFNWKPLAALLAAVIVLAGVGFGVHKLKGGDKDGTDTVVAPPVDTAQVDIDTVEEDTVEGPIPPQPPEPPVPPTPNPSWGRYDGQRDSKGLPNGNGIVYITRSYTINGESAEKGERIEGVFRNGYLNMGTWYKNDGNAVLVKGIKVL